MRLYNRTFVLLCLVLLLAVSVQASVPVHVWSQRFGGYYGDVGDAVAVDGSGNVIMTGAFEYTADFGGGTVTGGGGTDIFIAKYDPSGAHMWSQHFGSGTNDGGQAVAVDGSDNIIVTGLFNDTVDFGGGGLTSGGLSDIFVAKYDASGVHQWSRRFGESHSDIGRAVAVDGFGNVIVAGTFDGTVDFGGGNLTSAGLADIFVAKYDPSGAHLWSQRFGGNSSDAPFGIAVDGSGNVIVVGTYRNTVDLGGGAFTSVGDFDVFVAKYDASGFHQWSHSFGGTGADRGTAVAVDGSGNAIIGGYFEGTADFGGGSLTSTAFDDIFIAKYDPAGGHLWSQHFGGTGDDVCAAVAVDGSARVTVTGHFQGTANFGGGSLTSVGLTDVLVAQYDESGVYQWSRRFGGARDDWGKGLTAESSGEVIVTGRFEETVNFGGGDLTSAHEDDIFLAKYEVVEPVPVFIRSFEAMPRGDAVDVTWDLWSDENLDRFTLYRRQGASPAVVIASGVSGTTRSYTDRSVEPGETYHYELVIRAAGGDEFRSPIATATASLPEAALYQNVPNPFNPQTTISFTLPAAGVVTLAVYDVEGRLVRTLVEGTMKAGEAEVTWDGRDAEGTPVSTGVYFCRLQTGRETLTRRMVLLK